MAYSEAKVIAGGLAHIPIIIGVFWLIRSYFNKRINNFELAQKPTKPKTAVKTVENKNLETKKVESKVPDVKKLEDKAPKTNKVESKVPDVKKLEDEATKSISSEIKTVPPKTIENTKIDQKPLNKMKHADVPVNTYRPKTPFVGTVTENYSLLKE